MGSLQRLARVAAVTTAVLGAAIAEDTLVGLARGVSTFHRPGPTRAHALSRASTIAATPQASSSSSGGAEEQQARITCGGCHAFPPPDILPRAVWRDEFVRMMFIREKRLPPPGPPAVALRGIQLPPDMQQALAYFEKLAPERLPTPEAWPGVDESPVRFTRRALSLTEMPGAPAVSHVRLADLDGDSRLDLVGTDMRHGSVFSATPAASAQLTVVASIPHPAHVTPADVDRDGVVDLLVADMGEFFPSDHNKAAVIWLRGLGAGKYGAHWLDGWPRVADVQTADFNGDGRGDLAVAAFGWRQAGQIAVLENRTAAGGPPAFTNHMIDPRTGGIQAVPVDLNRDGRMDLVTVLAQEHETVVAYLNKGTGFVFDPTVLYVAPHPNWGSSGIHVVDLDGDGDLDVLLAHGDTFDDGIVKPYHGIQWLENRGTYPFVARTLAQMPGVHGIKTADLDGDGDLDIIAGALLAGGADVDEKVLPALGWLEQIKPGVFARHTLVMGVPRHASVDAGDIDNDGDIDIVAGYFSIDPGATGWVDVWTNQRLPSR